MNIQEQEDRDFEAGRASEFQNCFAEARMACGELGQDEQERISKSLDEGLFVVVDEQPYYCKATDAVAGSVQYFRQAFTTREAADMEAYRLQEGDPESRVFVLPMEAHEAPPAALSDALCAEDLPF